MPQKELPMKMVKPAALVLAGMVAGGSFVAFEQRTSAQEQFMDEMNARFAISDFEYAKRDGWTFRAFFLKDKKTGDCYLAHVDRATVSVVTKTDDNACQGF
jgi:hypothetical protein